jgi:hypothetical protein
MAETTLRSVHVDRVEELARFQDMIAGRGTAHVLLIQAEAGMGKSSLLREFWEQSAEHPRILVDFKSRTHSVESVLGELSSRNPPAFQRFYEQLQQPGTGPLLNMNRSEISRSTFNITQVVPDTPEQRDVRRLLLTQAFFFDLVASNPRRESMVAVFDTYEDASTDVKDWLSGLFLAGAREYRWLTVVVAGRQIPSLGIGWDDYYLEHTLRPLGPEHIGEYLRQLKLRVSDDVVVAIYQGTKGIPLDLSIFVGNLLLERELGDG